MHNFETDLNNLFHRTTYLSYVEKDGKRYAFAITVNNWTGSRDDLRVKIAHLIVDLFAPSAVKEVKKAA